MIKNELKQHKTASINIGSASLVMVFVVLALTIFSLLSLITSNNELRLSYKFANSIDNYYSADYAACVIIENIETKMENNTEIDLPGVFFDGNIGIFDVDINDFQKLHVVVDISNNELQILSWQVQPTVEQVFDNSMPVWTGTEGVF